MRIHRLLLHTEAEGPGVRACVWVQGCAHGCRGCFATELWDYSGGTEIRAEELIAQLAPVLDGLDGITLLGGEPMDQADELWRVAKYVRDRGKTVITFTGYVYEQLLAQADEPRLRLLEYTDLLGDGPFMEDRLDYSQPLLGSSNQRWLCLSGRIPREEIESYRNRFEVRVGADGEIRINGMGNIQKLKEYLRKVDVE